MKPPKPSSRHVPASSRPAHASQQSNGGSSSRGHDLPDAEQLKLAIATARPEDLRGVVQHLCALSPALRRAVYRCLRPESVYAQSTLTPAPAPPSFTPYTALRSTMPGSYAVKAEPNSSHSQPSYNAIKSEPRRSSGVPGRSPIQPQSSSQRTNASSKSFLGLASGPPSAPTTAGAAEKKKPAGLKIPPLITIDSDTASDGPGSQPSSSGFASQGRARNEPGSSVPTPLAQGTKRKRTEELLRCERCTRTFYPSSNRHGACDYHPGKLVKDDFDFYWKKRPAGPERPEDLDHCIYSCCQGFQDDEGCKLDLHVAMSDGKRERPSDNS